MINLEYSTKQMISYFIIVNRNFTLYKDKILINYIEKLKNILDNIDKKYELTSSFSQRNRGGKNLDIYVSIIGLIALFCCSIVPSSSLKEIRKCSRSSGGEWDLITRK